MVELGRSHDSGVGLDIGAESGNERFDGHIAFDVTTAGVDPDGVVGDVIIADDENIGELFHLRLADSGTQRFIGDNRVGTES